MITSSGFAGLTIRVVLIAVILFEILTLLSVLFTSTLTGIWSASPPHLPKVWYGWNEIEHLFVFGDAYADEFFKPFEKQPDLNNPFGNIDRISQNEIYTPKWPWFLTSQYNQSLIRTWNYAVAGSTVDKNVVPTWALSSTLTEEIRTYYEATARRDVATPNWKASNTLFAVFIGSNDINLSLEKNEATPITASVVAQRSALEHLYEGGARNFLIINVPPIALAKEEDAKRLTREATAYNLALSRMHKNFKRDHEDVTAFYFDIHSLMTDIRMDASAFPETRAVDDFGPWLGQCFSCKFLQGTGIDPNEAKCDENTHRHFWCEFMHIAYPVHNATAARIADDCFGKVARKKGDTRKRYCEF